MQATGNSELRGGHPADRIWRSELKEEEEERTILEASDFVSVTLPVSLTDSNSSSLLKLDLETLMSNFVSTFKSVAGDGKEGEVLLIVDHISSIPAVVFPVKQIVSEAHKHGIQVLVLSSF